VSISSGSAANTYGVGVPKKDKILFSGGSDSTTAKAGAGQSSGASSALLLLPSGMGVDEVDFTSPFTGPSFMVLDFTLVWDVSGSTFTPSNTAFNVTVGGTVGSGGSAKFEAVCQWNRKTGASTTFNIRPAYTPAAVTFGTAGTYLHSFNSGNSAISIPAGSQLIITGSIKMSANDPMDPTVSDFLLPRPQSGLPGELPVDCGVIIAPDTDDVPVTSTGQPTGEWSDPATWTTGDVPFHPTDNVMLDPLGSAPSTVNLDMNAGIGSVSLTDGDTLNVTAGNKLTLFGPAPSNLAGTFNNGGAFALINGASAAVTGTGNHTGAVSIDAGSQLQLNGGGVTTFGAASAITGAGDLAISGGGTIVNLNGTSTLTGTTGVAAGATVNLGNADGIGEGSAVAIAGNALIHATPGLAKAIGVASITTSTGGKLDLTNNSMVIKGQAAAQVQAQLASGYNDGQWNGATGIVSSSVPASMETSVGFATQAQLGVTEFKGVTGLVGTDVLVKYTYAGDANLDGKVDIGDLGLLAGGWQQLTGKVWFDGDFTYDGAVDIADLGLLAANWQKGTPGNPNPPLMTFSEAMAQFSAFDGVAVPEPAGVSLLALASGVGLLRRNRHKR
jgi:hypothetical protein